MNEINASQSQHQSWLFFALITVGCWGLYGAFLHSGQTGMQDPVNGRYKAFLCVGIAYFLTAVLAPLAILIVKGASWTYAPAGVAAWSLFAGIVGAAGAFSDAPRFWGQSGYRRRSSCRSSLPAPRS